MQSKIQISLIGLSIKIMLVAVMVTNELMIILASLLSHIYH